MTLHIDNVSDVTTLYNSRLDKHINGQTEISKAYLEDLDDYATKVVDITSKLNLSTVLDNESTSQLLSFSNDVTRINEYAVYYSSNATDDNVPAISLAWMTVVGMLLGVVVMVTTAGNMLVLLAVLVDSNLRRTTTHYFIANLALADLLVGTTVLPFSATLEVLHYWPFGQVFCDVWAAVDVLCCTASILSLCVISIDRYIGVTRPLQHSTIVNETRTACIIVSVWLLSLLISVAPLFGWKEPPSLDHTVCDVTKQTGYVLFSVIGSFYIPLAIILVVYYRVYRAALTQSRFLSTGIRTSSVSSLRSSHIRKSRFQMSIISRRSLSRRSQSSCGTEPVSAHPESGTPRLPGDFSFESSQSPITLRIHTGRGRSINGRSPDFLSCRNGSCSSSCSPAPVSRSRTTSVTVKCPTVVDDGFENVQGCEMENVGVTNKGCSKRKLEILAGCVGDFEAFEEKDAAQNAKRICEGALGPRIAIISEGQSDRTGDAHLGEFQDGGVSWVAGVAPVVSPSHFSVGSDYCSGRDVMPRRNYVSRDIRSREKSARDIATPEQRDWYQPDECSISSGSSRGTFSKKMMTFKREKKAAKTLGIVVGVFIFCWLPFFFILPLEALCKSCVIPAPLFKTIFWLGYCNSLINPFIYACSSRDFKRSFIRIVRCQWGVDRRRHWRREQYLNETFLALRSVQTTSTSIATNLGHGEITLGLQRSGGVDVPCPPSSHTPGHGSTAWSKDECTSTPVPKECQGMCTVRLDAVSSYFEGGDKIKAMTEFTEVDAQVVDTL